jgi:Arc/MetJ family transcription regulator
VSMPWWIKVAGTGETAYTQERWDERRARMRAEGHAPSLFPKRPRIACGDRLVVYASGSAAEYGEGRFLAVEEVLSEAPEPSGHDRWRWRVETRLLAAVDDLAHAPALREIGVSPKSLRQHSHIRLTAEQGMRALELLRGVSDRA